MRRKIAIFSTGTIVVALIVLVPASTTIKADGDGHRNHGIVPIDERPHGKTYTEWNAAFWKWRSRSPWMTIPCTILRPMTPVRRATK